jgi:hypothetical protein
MRSLASSRAQGSPRVAKWLPLTSRHRRKPGTGGFTSYQFEPHVAHLLVSSSVIRVIDCTGATAVIVNQDARKSPNSCDRAQTALATVLALLVLSNALNSLLRASRKRVHSAHADLV